MKIFLKKLGITLLCLIVAVNPVFAVEIGDNDTSDDWENTHLTGTCGENLTWTFYSDGTLEISGEGDMTDWDYNNEDTIPWRYKTINNIVINSGVTSIGSFAFNQVSFNSISIADTVTKIGNNAFGYCSLTSIDLPDGLTSIGDNAFLSCQGLTNILIPKNVEFIGVGPFSECYNLSGITVDEDNIHYSNDDKGVLFNENKTILVQYPLGASETTYSIPSGVETISKEAFCNCSGLTRVDIPNSVTSIEDSAFAIPNLTDVYFVGTETDWNSVSIGTGNDPLLNASVHLVSAIDFDGTSIIASADCKINLSNYNATEVPGKTFIGWKYEDDTYPESEVKLSAGQKLVAEYIDFNSAVGGDLSTIGAQIRESEPMGLRYISQIDGNYITTLKSISGNDVEFGSAVLPSDFHEGQILDAETEYSVGDKTYTASLVKAQNIYKTVYDENDKSKIKYQQFTVVLINLKSKNYTRDYTVRSYVKFTDHNGVERFAYGEQYATSIYNMAVYAIAHPEDLNTTALNTCYNIVSIVETLRDNEVADSWG